MTARCPKGQFLVSGGFQRTNFRSDGGDYITESRMASKKSWTVTGSAYGTGQGELTAIAYCARMSKPKLTEVASCPAPIAANQLASTTTPSCPKGKRLVAGGFSNGGGSPNAFFAEGTINRSNSFTARSYGFFGAGLEPDGLRLLLAGEGLVRHPRPAAVQTDAAKSLMPLDSRHLTLSPVALSLRVTWVAVAETVTAVPFALEVSPVETNGRVAVYEPLRVADGLHALPVAAGRRHLDERRSSGRSSTRPWS